MIIDVTVALLGISFLIIKNIFKNNGMKHFYSLYNVWKILISLIPQPYTGMDNCTVCPAGYMCPDMNLTLAQDCQSGRLSAKLPLSYSLSHLFVMWFYRAL